MIHPEPHAIILSIPIAQALLAFTGKTDRIGVNDSNLCATNGNVALRFHTPVIYPNLGEGSCWSHGYVKQRIAMAKAMKSSVSLLLADIATQDYPNQKLVEPAYASIHSVDGSIGINAEALALLEIVAKACTIGKVIPPAVLVTATGPLSPLRFTFSKPIQATVTIMPTRY